MLKELEIRNNLRSAMFDAGVKQLRVNRLKVTFSGMAWDWIACSMSELPHYGLAKEVFSLNGLNHTSRAEKLATIQAITTRAEYQNEIQGVYKDFSVFNVDSAGKVSITGHIGGIPVCNISQFAGNGVITIDFINPNNSVAGYIITHLIASGINIEIESPDLPTRALSDHEGYLIPAYVGKVRYSVVQEHLRSLNGTNYYMLVPESAADIVNEYLLLD